MRRFLKITDAVLLLLWRILRGILLGLKLLLNALSRIVQGIWRTLPQNRFQNSIERFLDGLDRFFPTDYLARKTKRLASHLENSAKARRWFFVVIFLVFCLWWYPPSAWGPWHHYQRGISSHYGRGFYFRKTASGSRFYPWSVSAAHRQLPLGTIIKVVNRENGRSLVLKVNDRGPYVEGRILDLSTRAGKKLGIIQNGTAMVDIYTRKRNPIE